MRKDKGLFDAKQLALHNAVLVEENERVRKELAESKATIRFLVKAALVVEEERDKFQKMASDDVPF